MSLKFRKEYPVFYKVLDQLMCTNYKECTIRDGIYILRDGKMKIDARIFSFYFDMNPEYYKASQRFTKSGWWSNQLLKCGFKISYTTGYTYSYPGLRDYIGKEMDNEEDQILRATYYFACINQQILLFDNQLGDLTFNRVDNK